MKHKTFQQKLDRFKREPIGFLVKSKEIADELAKAFEREGMKSCTGNTAEEFMKDAWIHYGIDCNLYVAYNFPEIENGLSYGMSDSSGEWLDELLDITLEELKSYSAPQTLEDKLKLFKAGTHVLYTPTQEIYDKLMVELEKRGYALVGDESLEVAKKYWEKYKENMCIRYALEGQYYGSRGEYLKENIKILTLTPADFSSTQVITITSDGYHRVTAESNGVTAEALCNPTDTFDISKGSHIALQRLLEKVKECTVEEPEFCVGDIVEIMGTDANFLKESIGLQGVILRIGEYGRDKYLVELPVAISGDNKWLYDNLKLIRRVNV